MEGCGHGSSLPNRDRQIIFAFGGNHLYAPANTGDLGGADEDHFQRGVPQLPFPDGTVDLAAVGIGADGVIDGARAALFGVFQLSRHKISLPARSVLWPDPRE